MYFPFLRGRRFELQALQDLNSQKDIYDNGLVIPIIEPVTIEKSCLRAYSKLVAMKTPFIFIVNPQAGDLGTIGAKKITNGILDAYQNFYPGFIIHQLTRLDTLKRFLDFYKDRKVSLIHYTLPGENDKIAEHIKTVPNIAHNIFLSANFTNNYIIKINSPGSKKITLIDGFNKQENNPAYAMIISENFCDIHFKFKDEGFDGFGDFCSIGEKFEIGFGLPRAVVIHWSSLADEGKRVLMNHFVSDDMEGTSNTAGKFIEAYNKLKKYNEDDPLFVQTFGGNIMKNYGDEGRAPELGRVKKISIMHHIELIRNTLN